MNSVCIVGGWWQLASLPSQTIFFLSFTKSVTHVTLSDCNCLIGDVWQSTKLDLSVRSVASASWRIGNVFNWNGDVWASATNALCFGGRWTVGWVKRCRGFALSLFEPPVLGWPSFFVLCHIVSAHTAALFSMKWPKWVCHHPLRNIVRYIYIFCPEWFFFITV